MIEDEGFGNGEESRIVQIAQAVTSPTTGSATVGTGEKSRGGTECAYYLRRAARRFWPFMEGDIDCSIM